MCTLLSFHFQLNTNPFKLFQNIAIRIWKRIYCRKNMVDNILQKVNQFTNYSLYSRCFGVTLANHTITGESAE